jgi:hypothetical protein
MIVGTAGATEALVWTYAKGWPADRVEQGASGAFAALTNEDLKRRLPTALTAMPEE